MPTRHESEQLVRRLRRLTLIHQLLEYLFRSTPNHFARTTKLTRLGYGGGMMGVRIDVNATGTTLEISRQAATESSHVWVCYREAFGRCFDLYDLERNECSIQDERTTRRSRGTRCCCLWYITSDLVVRPTRQSPTARSLHISW